MGATPFSSENNSLDFYLGENLSDLEYADDVSLLNNVLPDMRIISGSFDELATVCAIHFPPTSREIQNCDVLKVTLFFLRAVLDEVFASHRMEYH